jgi:protein ImuB
VVTEGKRILACDSEARKLAVRPRMSIATALSLAPNISLLCRDLVSEKKALNGIATFALQFTPGVTIELPDIVLLEISGSLNLFGGLERIIERVRAGIQEFGYTMKLALSPTALASSWFARSGQKVLIEDPERFKDEILALPASVLNCDEKVSAMLKAIGVETVGDLLTLPRAGLARRFGKPILDELDRALGNSPDPRAYFFLPDAFFREIEMPAPVSEAEALLFAAKRLLIELKSFLVARAGGLQRFTLNLIHDKGHKTSLVIGFISPTRDLERFLILVREKLYSASIPQPVFALSLQADEISPLLGQDLDLFPGGSSQGETLSRLIERLQVRLGRDTVQKLELNQDHRPERASVFMQTMNKCERLEFGRRPLWLLEHPRAIQEIDSIPHYGGPLKLIAGPERLESGWWDGGDITRDYFIAETSERSFFWVFRDRQTTSWYLHGVFA